MNSRFPSRIVRIGGATKPELLAMLRNAGVRLNEAAEELLADARFSTLSNKAFVATQEVSVGGLGFRDGATFRDLVDRAASRGLAFCPLELAPHLRLQFKNQPEGFLGKPRTQNCAPPGSLTVASAPLSEEDGFPQGFYLRRIEDALWLRGYTSSPDHVWNSRDVFVFARSQNE